MILNERNLVWSEKNTFEMIYYCKKKIKNHVSLVIFVTADLVTPFCTRDLWDIFSEYFG